MTFSPDGGLKNSKDGREKETGVSWEHVFTEASRVNASMDEPEGLVSARIFSTRKSG